MQFTARLCAQTERCYWSGVGLFFGAEAAPLSAYLLGLVIAQTAPATAIAWLIRQKGAAMLGRA